MPIKVWYPSQCIQHSNPNWLLLYIHPLPIHTIQSATHWMSISHTSLFNISLTHRTLSLSLMCQVNSIFFSSVSFFFSVSSKSLTLFFCAKEFQRPLSSTAINKQRFIQRLFGHTTSCFNDDVSVWDFDHLALIQINDSTHYHHQMVLLW